MHTPPSFRSKLRALFNVVQFRPRTIIVVFSLGVATAFLEGIGIGFIVPVIQTARGDSAGKSRLIEVFRTAYETLGVPFTLETIMLGIGFVMVLRYGSTFLVAWLRAILETTYIRHLQQRGYRAALDAEISYFEEYGSDEMLNAIIKQADYAGSTINQVVRLFELGTMCLMYAALAVVIAPTLAIGSGILFGISTYVFRTRLESGYSAGDRVADGHERIQSVVQAGIQGARDVKTFGLIDELDDRFSNAIDQYTESTITLRRNQNAIASFYQLIGVLTIFSLIYVSLRFTSLSLGSLAVFLFAMFRLIPRVSTLSNTFYKAQGNLPHLVRLQEFTERLEARSERGDGTQTPPETVSGVKFDEVSFTYSDGTQVLDTVSFEFERGDFVAFVGPSGAGKSTIVSLLARLYEPDTGEILVEDRPISEFRIDAWRDHVSIVRQKPFLFSDTLRYNLTIGNRDATEEEIKQACAISNVDEFFPSLPDGLDTELGEDGVRLSGGQRQRVAIARSILEDPDILVLDEATSDLDSISENDVQAGIESMDNNYALVVVAHRLSTVTNADVIHVMEDGKMLESGNHDELMGQDGLYSSLYRHHK
ncbi:ABC transporter ATP-binding protein [Haloarcula marina]|uniref:ABC transporter ATP-binding protein n=1 Tax=Haloarcula marina TaxID=2961574 RepID=UPI0020B8C836|nr:ABC transporter ATP-binding protein [Halomicroarcula marina]